MLPLQRPRERAAPASRFRGHARCGDVIEEVRPPPARRAYHRGGRRVPPRQFALGEDRRLSHLVDAPEGREGDEIVPHGGVGHDPQRLDNPRLGVFRGRVREEDRAAPSRQGLLGPVPRRRDAQAERVVGIVVRLLGGRRLRGAGHGRTRRRRRRRRRREEERGGGGGEERSTIRIRRRDGGGDDAPVEGDCVIAREAAQRW